MLKTGNFFAIIAILGALASASSTSAQSRGDREALLAAVRSGQLRITDEMIESQRKQHPELKGLSNAQIRQRIEDEAHGRKNAEGTGSGSGENPGSPGLAPRSDEAAPASSLNGSSTPSAGPGTSGPHGLSGAPGMSNGVPASGASQNGSRFPAELTRFGYDFFRQGGPGSAGGAEAHAPALPEYILSPGDEIVVYTWGRENQTQTLAIDNEGMFHYPPLQPMRLSGMRFAEAQALIVREVQNINGVKASVGMGKLKSIRIFVLGEAKNPGSYVVPAGATVTTALFQCGGIREIGSLRAVQLRRGGRTVATLDLYDMLLKGANRNDVQLLAGDALFIPVAPIQIAVTGLVKRPAVYEVRPGTRILEALDLAGGLSSNALKGRLRLDRVENHRRKVVLDVPMDKPGKSAATVLQDGDILFVDEVLAREFDVVYLRGNVNRPGRYEWKKGMTVKDLIPSNKDLKGETYFNYGHILRSAEDDERSLLLPFSLSDVMGKGSSVALQPRDTVIIYSKYDIMDQPKVKAAGAVRKAGTFDFVDKMRVSDLIIAAGGLTIEAYLPEAHLLRILRVQESDSLFSTLQKVNLTSIIENPGDGNNAELRPFDSLIVFPRSNFILPKSVSIEGAVKKNGDYQLTENMGISELISQAEGLTKGTYKVAVEVVRKKVENDSVVRREVRRVRLKDILEGRESFRLEDGDNIYVREVVDYRESMRIYLKGEFNFPGKYEFAQGERLGDLVRRAGGFTPNAYLRGAVFIRKSVKEQQLKHVEEIGRRLENQMQILLERTNDEKERAAVTSAVTQRKAILTDIQNAPYLGRIVVKLDSKKFMGSEYDITLEDGDSLYVGPQPNTISILGEVYSPTNVIFTRDNNSIGECLGRAGGVSEYGDYGNTFYMRPDGSVLTPRNDGWFSVYSWRSVEPGGSIVVPPKGPKKDMLDVLTKVTQIIYQIAISVGVAKTVY